MRNYEGLVHAAGVFTKDRGGSFAVLFGLAASVLALGVGFSVNISQIYNAKSSLQGVGYVCPWTADQGVVRSAGSKHVVARAELAMSSTVVRPLQHFEWV